MNNIAKIIQAVNLALAKGISFYAYRLPGDALSFSFGAQVDVDYTANRGFRIVPFITNHDTPTCTIFPQLSAEEILLDTEIRKLSEIPEITIRQTSKTEYLKSAQICISSLRDHQLQKVVLSRVIIQSYSSIDWGLLLVNLATIYPTAFVFIYYTPQSGAWIGASPETLGSYRSGIFRTMALAGTRPTGQNDWKLKEFEEQNVVVSYIESLIRSNGLTYTKSEKYIRNAGNVAHLCNDFVIQEDNYQTIENLIQQLHPTPAVAGLPKEEAINLITATESHTRRYYGGYIGPFSESGFDYFVNLRSMQFSDTEYAVYVGGGLTKDSVPKNEWIETCEKSKTLLNVIHQM